MNIRFGKKFGKQYKKAPDFIREAVDSRIILFKNNPLEPVLHNHALTGNFKGYRSINITGDWRAIFFESSENNARIVIFIGLGTHSQLYK